MENAVFDGEALAGEERRCKCTVDVLELAIQAEETVARVRELVAPARAELAALEAGEADSDSDEEGGPSAVKQLLRLKKDLAASKKRLSGDAAAYCAASRPSLSPYVRDAVERLGATTALVVELPGLDALLEKYAEASESDEDDIAAATDDDESDEEAETEAGAADRTRRPADAQAEAARATPAAPIAPPSAWPRDVALLLGPVLKPRATVLKRNVVSLCLFGSKAIYCVGAVQNAKLCRALLPEWKLVVYCNPGDVPQRTCDALVDAGAEVRLVSEKCREKQLMLLRFLPCGEAGVEAVAVRDADSRLNPRDAAALDAWLARTDSKFHVLHERPHDATKILGGMWGARAPRGSKQPPLPKIYDHMAAFVKRRPTTNYGDDMLFLDEYVRPLCTDRNTCHHSAAHGRFLPNLVPRPFPETPYEGFVGQPINCPNLCDWDAFLDAGPPHVRAGAQITPEVASKLRHQPDVIAGIGAFLGGAAAATPPPPPPA